MAYGTLSTLDTLASSQQSIAAYGEDRAFEAISVALDAHNSQMRGMIEGMIEITTDRQRRYGSADTMVMQELDEFGAPDAQKIGAGVTVGFPLRKYGAGLQWTRTYMQNARASEMAAQVTAMMDADVTNVMNRIKTALMTSTNASYLDRYVDNVTLAGKALLNADGAAIPLGPNGETFVGGSHTHYLATASLVNADLVSLYTTVLEHSNAGKAVIYIPVASEVTVRALADFKAYTDARLINQTAAIIGRAVLDVNNIYNRPIGLFGPAEVWVKPWMPTSYIICTLEGGRKPLVFRERNPGSGTFQLMFEDEQHPLRCRGYEREFGIGVWNRTAAAVLYTASGTYAIPTFA